MSGVTRENIGWVLGRRTHSSATVGPYNRLNSLQMLSRQEIRLSTEAARTAVAGLAHSRANSSGAIRPNSVRASLAGTPQAAQSRTNACSAAGLARAQSAGE